jgi:tetratricopeptide (TPR) repeat protein
MASLARLREYLLQDPDNLRLLADVADLTMEIRDLAAARATIDHALQVSPGNPYFQSRLSSIALAEQQWDEAISVCRRLIADNHTDSAIRYNLARALVHAGQFDEAKIMLEALRGEQRLPPDVSQLLIRTLHTLGDVAGAIAVAKDHLEGHPDDHQVAGMLSLLYVDDSNLESARTWSEKSLAGAPNNLDALLAAGTLQLASEDDAAADRHFDVALSVTQSNGRAWVGKALAKLLRLDLVGARADFEQAVRHMPTHVGTWHGLAWVQLLQNDIKSAASSFEKAYDLDRNFGESHGGLGVVAAFEGKWQEAETHSKTALKLDPQSFSGRFVRSLILQRAGRGGTAQQLLERMLRSEQAPGGGSLADMVRRVASRNQRGH